MSGTIGDARKREAEASTSTEPFDSNDAITIAKYGTPVAQDAASAPETARRGDSIPKTARNTNDVISGRPLGDDEREALRFYASGECNQFDAKRILRLLDALEAAEREVDEANRSADEHQANAQEMWNSLAGDLAVNRMVPASAVTIATEKLEDENRTLKGQLWERVDHMRAMEQARMDAAAERDQLRQANDLCCLADDGEVAQLRAKVERVEALATRWVVDEALLSGSEPLGVAVRLCHKELRDALRGDS